MSENQGKDPILEKKSSRRQFLKNSSIAVGGLLVGGGIGNLLTKEKVVEKEVVSHNHSVSPAHNYGDAWQFFTRKEDFDILSHASETIFPEDELGPGAIALGVPYYIDKQLASPWAIHADDYRKKPLLPGETPLNRNQIMLDGIRKIQEVSEKDYGSDFIKLEEEQKIGILAKFEAGEVEMKGVTSREFFSLLRSLTIEGCYCDPLYGGNKNMDGWRMKEFPGAQMAYIQYVDKEEFVKIDPLSLSDHQH